MPEHLLTINRQKASTLMISTAIALLVWAAGSYILYLLYAPEPRVCLPLFTGCVSISSTGMTALSGVFYRAMILPLAPFLGFTFLLGLHFLSSHIPTVSAWIKTTLWITGVILCPVFLIIAQATLNGTFAIPYPKTHILLSKLAFLMPVIYQAVLSFSLLTAQNSNRTKVKCMCLISLVNIPCYLCMAFSIVPIHRFSTIMQWNLFLLLCIWIILLGLSIRQSPAFPKGYAKE